MEIVVDRARTAVDLPAYFSRIGHRGGAAPTLANLQSIHARHVDAIAFENLAAFLGEPVPLDLASLQAKLLVPGRGGWCFEHNLFLAAVLEAMGYEVRRLAARVRWNVPANVVTPRSHMLMRVRVAGEDFIADTGFGGLTLSAALRLVPGAEQATPHEPHRLLEEGEGYALQAKIAGEWATMYVFDLHEHQQADYEVSNWYLANNPRSQFVNGIIAARAAPGVRHALRNTRYSIHHADGRTERRFLADASEFRAILREAFHVEVPASQLFEEKIARTIAANPPA
ncbi:MAG: arylamine N-acetyltransferase [Usitatibacter sp.]